MPYSPSYLDFVLEQLSGALPAVNSRPMFGGVGIYSHGVFFSLIAEDMLYFFTDDSNRADFEEREMGRFSSRYFEVPAGVLEDPDELREWAWKAFQAAKNRPDHKKRETFINTTTALKTSLARLTAVWVNQDTLLWKTNAAPKERFSLHYSPDAALAVGAEGIEGGQEIPLHFSKTGPGGDVFENNPYLRGWPAFKIDPADFARLPEALKGQLGITARDSQGRLIDASGMQIAGALDGIYTYDGPLGVTFEGKQPSLRVWAPTARSVRLRLFEDSSTPAFQTVGMNHDPLSGVWSVIGQPGWKGQYYLYEVQVYVPATGRIETNLATDPYSLSLSTNSLRSQIVDLGDADLQPAGWDGLAKPALAAPQDIVVYELHLRDFSVHDETVPPALRGTYAAFTVKESDGMRHLAGLARAGLTHLHLLPVFDIATINEDKSAWQTVDEAELAALPPASYQQALRIARIKSQDGYNWGYDPYHYSVPEGSYASDPNGPARILEFRQMVQSLNQAGLRVVMDVVYNHTTESGQNPKSVLDKIVPGYYYRLSTEGKVETSTCCQNTASEHAMMRKLMVDSLVQWARQYKVDGFRFDLMGHHMLADMQAARAALDGLSPEKDGVDGKAIYLYGEGWNFGEVAQQARGINAIQQNIGGTGIGVFNDRLRDAVRGGSTFGDPREQGFSTGLLLDPNAAEHRSPQDQKAKLLETSDWIRLGLAGNLRDFHLVNAWGGMVDGTQVRYNGSPAGYTLDPAENVVYVSAHDNETIFDAVQLKAPEYASLAERIRMNNLALSFPMFSQGVAFFHAGDDILRSKSLERNSFDSGDWFNKLDWTLNSNNWGVGLPIESGERRGFFASLLENPALKPARAEIEGAAAVFREFLQIRKSSPLFRLRTAAEIQRDLAFLNSGPDQIPGLIVMLLQDGGGLDPNYSRLAVLFNANAETIQFYDPTLVGQAYELHPILRQSADTIARRAAFDSSGGGFSIPGRTTSVFVVLHRSGE